MSKFSNKTRPFIILETFIMNMTDIGLNEKVLLSYLYGLIKSGMSCEMSNAWLGWIFHVDARTIGRWLSKLEATKKITRTFVNHTDREIRVIAQYQLGTIIMKDDSDNHSSEKLSTPHDRIVAENPDPGQNCQGGYDKIVRGGMTDLSTNNKDYKKENKKTGTGKPVSSNLTLEEEKALKLLKSKFRDPKINLKQMREVLKLHSSKEATLEWSINNYLNDIKTNGDDIRNLVGVFIKRLEAYNSGYYPDNRVYTKDDDGLNFEEEAPHGFVSALMGNDIGEAKKIAQNSSRSNSSYSTEDARNIIRNAFKEWYKNAHQSLKDRFQSGFNGARNNPMKAAKSYFIEKVVPGDTLLSKVYQFAN